MKNFIIGDKVRLLEQNYFGQIGTIVELTEDYWNEWKSEIENEVNMKNFVCVDILFNEKYHTLMIVEKNKIIKI